MLTIRSLERTTYEEIAKTFNTAFSDYFFPIVFTKEQFEDKFFSEGGRLDLSVGVFKNENLVAFILHFADVVNGIKIIYNGGTGVIPTFRGNRLTSKMYEFILPKLKDANVDKMILAVLNENTSALRIYQNRGFQIMREVNSFKGKLNGKIRSKLKDSYEILELKKLNWNILQSFWDFQPTWQNSISTMNHFQRQNLCIGVKKDDLTIGYLIYNPKIKRIHQMAIDKEYRNIGLGDHLLKYISKIEKQDISFINIDSRIKGFKNLLEKRGLKNYFNQYEMELKLCKPITSL